MVSVNRNALFLYFYKPIQIISEAPFLAGEIEVNESYFGSVQMGNRGKGAAVKVPVFGLLTRGDWVYTVKIEDAKFQTLLVIIRDRFQPYSIVYIESFRSYELKPTTTGALQSSAPRETCAGFT